MASVFVHTNVTFSIELNNNEEGVLRKLLEHTLACAGESESWTPAEQGFFRSLNSQLQKVEDDERYG